MRCGRFGCDLGQSVGGVFVFELDAAVVGDGRVEPRPQGVRLAVVSPANRLIANAWEERTWLT